MAFVTLDPEDIFLISMEAMIVFGLFFVLYFALKVRSQYPELTSEGWLVICAGIGSTFLHGLFDVLDTLKWDISGVELKDWLNVFDGSFFVIGILLIGYGILRIAQYGVKAWELD